jgi:hypothetical protein
MTFKALTILGIFLGATAASAPAADLTAEQVEPAYSAELGPLYQSSELQQLYDTNRLIDHYFSATTSSQRAEVVQQLAAGKLDPAVIGRLTRIRLDWPDLAPGVYYLNEQVGPYTVKYFLGLPKNYHRTVAWPLVVKLPGINAFLTDPMPDADTVVRIYSNWIKEELAAHPDAIVLMPLLNLKELYGPSFLGMNTVFQPLLDAAGRVNIDPARVYIFGHSMAAHAAWNLALHYGTYLAAFCALAGGADADWQRLRLMNLRNVLPVVWADTDDQIVPYTQSSEIVSALRKLKIDVDYTQTTGVGHVPTPEIAEAAYQKMRARVRDLYPAHVSMQSDRPEPIFNRMDWIQAYQELEPGADKQVRLQLGTGPIHLFGNSYTLDATLDHNTVKMQTTNLESMRLYFNDRMVDFAKPVVVIINNRERFHGMLTPSVDEMLKDQLFLGRGWRYFSAVLDIDLLDSPSTPIQSATPAAAAAPTSRPHGRITVYNDDGSVQRVIESP